MKATCLHAFMGQKLAFFLSYHFLPPLFSKSGMLNDSVGLCGKAMYQDKSCQLVRLLRACLHCQLLHVLRQVKSIFSKTFFFILKGGDQFGFRLKRLSIEKCMMTGDLFEAVGHGEGDDQGER